MREFGNVGPWETRIVFAVIVCIVCDHLTHASGSNPSAYNHRVDTSDQSLSTRDTRSADTGERSKVKRLLCYTCNGKYSNDECNESNLTACEGGQDACQMELRYIDYKLSITKRCKKSDACRADTRGNADNCTGTNLSPVCYYCCRGFRCNKDLPVNPLNQGVDPRAVYILTYEVLYNTSQTSQVTSRCGEFYAHSFLENFVSAEQKLNESCEALRVNVTVDIRARVRIHGNKSMSSYNVCKWIHRQYWLHGSKSPEGARVWTFCSPNIAQKSVVEVNAYVNLSNNVFTPEEHVLRCAAMIRRMLLRFDSFEHEVCPKKRSDCFTIIPPNRDLNCIQAQISPRTFNEKSHAWACPNELLFDNATKTCRPEVTSPVVPTLSLTTAASVPRGTTTDDRFNPPVTSSSSPSDLSEVTPGRANISDGSSTAANYLTITSSSDESSLLATTEYTATGSWGIEILNQSSWLQLLEGGDTKDLYFRLRANKTELCNGTEENCSISLRFSVYPAFDTYIPRCRSTDVEIPQVVIGQPSWATSSSHDYCSMTVTEESVDRDHTLPLKAMLDWKYDGYQTQRLHVTLNVTQDGDVRVEEEIIHDVPIMVVDKDRKSTCQSINDPHVTTFDGLEYNNFYEGEFVLYRHTDLPFSVHAIYQQCGHLMLASCNCAVAVQSGDDVIVIDRCTRKRRPFLHIDGTYDDDPLTVMSVDLYLNGELTEGTRVYEESDGKKYIIYLPHGAYVKVMVSGSLVNVWVVPSPSDLEHTKGLCGTYDWNTTNEFNLRNGSILAQPDVEGRPQPHEFILDWRVELFGPDSIFRGVSKGDEMYPPLRYCTCVGGQPASCGYFHDISTCDIYQGVDITSRFIHNAINLTTSSSKTRKKRAINENSIIKADEPILINKGFKPKDAHPWKNGWNKTFAYTFCGDYIRDKYPLGQLCSQIPGVNFNQEITTCVEDIHIIGNDSWADSARDAMKEQCLDEIQKNGNLPRNITEQIEQSMCINDCSKRGHCVNGGCQCQIGFSSADCSVEVNEPPYKVELPKYGLCDRRYMSCDAVIVYGKNFVDSRTLKCHLKKCQVLDMAWNVLPDPAILVNAQFINFNAVECPIPSHNQSYIVKVTNDGLEFSAGLMFIPFDSRCNDCSTNTTTCVKKRNSCIIDGECYADKDLKDGSNDSCKLCKPYDNEYSWTTLQVPRCRPPWWQNVPDWVVALAAAVGGSLVGLLVGFLLYKCCCKTRQKPDPAQEVALDNPDILASTPFEDHVLHRNRGLPAYSGSGDQFADLALRQPDYEETYFYNDGRGVENGIDSNTYFY